MRCWEDRLTIEWVGMFGFELMRLKFGRRVTGTFRDMNSLKIKTNIFGRRGMKGWRYRIPEKKTVCHHDKGTISPCSSPIHFIWNILSCYITSSSDSAPQSISNPPTTTQLFHHPPNTPHHFPKLSTCSHTRDISNFTSNLMSCSFISWLSSSLPTYARFSICLHPPSWEPILAPPFHP